MRSFVIGIERTCVELSRTMGFLARSGFEAEVFYGLDADVTGLDHTKWTYDLDHPGSSYHIGPLSIGNALSHIVLWKALKLVKDEDYFLVMEDDVRYITGARAKLDVCISNLPDDWDLLYVGSCNSTEHKVGNDLGGGLFRVSRALCTHSYLVRAKALDTLILECQKIWAPIDISMMVGAFDSLNVYAILPRLADQRDTAINS